MLAGGAALVAHGLSERPTRDLDFFTSAGSGSVGAVHEEFELAAGREGWEVVPVRTAETFVRIVVRGPGDMGQTLVDIAVDSRPTWPPTVSFMGPTLAPEELAGRKVVALFDRAEARDFADVYVLAQRFGKPLLIDEAQRVDAGVHGPMLARMMARIDRFQDDEIPVGAAELPQLREFFDAWRSELGSE